MAVRSAIFKLLAEKGRLKKAAEIMRKIEGTLDRAAVMFFQENGRLAVKGDESMAQWKAQIMRVGRMWRRIPAFGEDLRVRDTSMRFR